MLKNLIDYIKDNKYLIAIYDKFIYIYNYEKILNVSNTLIEIKLNDKIIKISGNNLFIKKMENKELTIEGIFKGIDYNE